MGQLCVHEQRSARTWYLFRFHQLHNTARTRPIHFAFLHVCIFYIAPVAGRIVRPSYELSILSREIHGLRPLLWEHRFRLSFTGRAPPFHVSTAFISHACRPASCPFLSGLSCFALDAVWRPEHSFTIRSPSVGNRTAGISVDHPAWFHSSDARPAAAQSAKPPAVPQPALWGGWRATPATPGLRVRR